MNIKDLMKILKGSSEFASMSNLFNIEQEDFERINKQISTLMHNVNTMIELCKESSKFAKNEEELKYIWFRMGQIEMANLIIKHLGEMFEKTKSMVMARTGVEW